MIIDEFLQGQPENDPEAKAKKKLWNDIVKTGEQMEEVLEKCSKIVDPAQEDTPEGRELYAKVGTEVEKCERLSEELDTLDRKIKEAADNKDFVELENLYPQLEIFKRSFEDLLQKMEQVLED